MKKREPSSFPTTALQKEDTESIIQHRHPSSPKISLATTSGLALLHQEEWKNIQSFRVLLLTILVLQNTLTALLGRFTRQANDKSDLYSIGEFIVVSECFKLVASVLLEMTRSARSPQILPHSTAGATSTTTGRSTSTISYYKNRFQKLNDDLCSHPRDLLSMSIPALFYLASNTLLYTAISNLSVPIFQVMVQSKLVVTALVSVLMLGRRYSLQQWVCLITISLSVTVITVDEKKALHTTSTTSNNAQLLFLESNEPLIIGIVAVTLSCLMSAFAGVYLEKVLKTKTNNPPSIWIRNIQMAIWSIIIACLQHISRGESDEMGKEAPTAFLHGFTPLVWCQVVLFAGGGLLVSAVIKYTDNVLKGVATGISVMLSTVASMILYGTPVTPLFPMCMVAIVTAVYFFSNEPKACCYAATLRRRHSPLIYVVIVLVFTSTLFLLETKVVQEESLFSLIEKKNDSFLSDLNLSEGVVKLQKEVQSSPMEKKNDLFPSDWNSSEKALAALRSVQDQIQERSFHEATHILYDLRTYLGNRPVKYLEIGSYTGISSSLVMSHPFPTYASLVDPCILSSRHFKGVMDQESTIRKNIAKIVRNHGCKLTRPWDLYVGFSPAALPVGETFDIIFIDGDRSTKGVWSDYNNTVNLLRPGGFMVFDDYLDWKDSPDVRGAVDNIAKMSDLIPIGTPRNIHGIHPQVNASFINEFIFQKPGQFTSSPLRIPGLNDSTPVLCVTVATYRRPDGSTPPKMERLWRMLKEQSYSNWKLYLTGDCYDDDIEWKSLSFYNDHRAEIYNLPEPGERGKLTEEELWHNAGAAAMNNAIERAVGDGHEWIVHLDDDDKWDTDHLQNIVEGIRTGATFVTTWCQYMKMEKPLPIVSTIQTGISHTAPPKLCDTIHSSIAFNAAKISTRYKRFPGFPADGVMWTRIQYDEGFYPAFVPVKSCYHLKERGGKEAKAVVRKCILHNVDPPPGWYGAESTHSYHTLATNEFPPTISPKCEYIIGPKSAAAAQPRFRSLESHEIPYHIRTVKEFSHLPVWAKK